MNYTLHNLPKRIAFNCENSHVLFIETKKIFKIQTSGGKLIIWMFWKGEQSKAVLDVTFAELIENLNNGVLPSGNYLL